MLCPTFGVSLSFYPAVQLLNFPCLKECLSNPMTPARQVCSSLEYKVVNLFFFFFKVVNLKCQVDLATGCSDV